MAALQSKKKKKRKKKAFHRLVYLSFVWQFKGLDDNNYECGCPQAKLPTVLEDITMLLQYPVCIFFWKWQAH